MNRHALIAVAVLLVAGVRPFAQAPAPGASTENPAFDVVSIKPDAMGPTGPTMLQIQPGGRYVATNVSLTTLIIGAYRLQTFQLSGAPSWAASDRFDVSAKAPDGVNLQQQPNPDPKAPPGPFQLMMRAMLADRFKLKVHTESRDVPTYELVLARTDGKLGPKLTRSTTDCAAEAAAARARGTPPAPLAFGQPMKCGMRIGPGLISAGSILLTQFAANISGQVGRTVVDRTGLTGNFDVDLTFTPDRMPTRAPGSPVDAPLVINGVAIDPNGPSLLTAIQEQLGLKLESAKGSLDFVVIDSVEHPTED